MMFDGSTDRAGEDAGGSRATGRFGRQGHRLKLMLQTQAETCAAETFWETEWKRRCEN